MPARPESSFQRSAFSAQLQQSDRDPDRAHPKAERWPLGAERSPKINHKIL